MVSPFSFLDLRGIDQVISPRTFPCWLSDVYIPFHHGRLLRHYTRRPHFFASCFSSRPLLVVWHNSWCKLLFVRETSFFWFFSFAFEGAHSAHVLSRDSEFRVSRWRRSVSPVIFPSLSPIFLDAQRWSPPFPLPLVTFFLLW